MTNYNSYKGLTVMHHFDDKDPYCMVTDAWYYRLSYSVHEKEEKLLVWYPSFLNYI